MQWSRLKQQVKDRLSPRLADRIDLHSAAYRWNQEADGRIWLTVDGDEVANFCSQIHGNRAQEIVRELLEQGGDEWSSSEALREAEAILNRQGQLTRSQARRDLEAYLDLAVEEAMESDSPLHLALAVLDRRLGKRRLRELELPCWAPGFVSRLLALRLEVEGLDRGRGRGEAAKQGGIT